MSETGLAFESPIINYPDCDYLYLRFPDRDKGFPVII